jgi:hypothetical protein
MFVVNDGTEEYYFENINGLYKCDFRNIKQVFLNTLSLGNKKELVEEFKRKLGYVSNQALVKAINDSSIKNLPIDLIDVRKACRQGHVSGNQNKTRPPLHGFYSCIPFIRSI